MHLRRATLDDAHLLFTWRNNLQTRLQSKNTDEIAWENHLSWLTQSLAMHSRKIYLAEHKGVLIGTVRSDKNEDGVVELSWTIAPEHRGKGLGKDMVMQFVKQMHPGEKLMAIIRKGNIPSEKIAEALGLQKEDPAISKNSLEDLSFIIWR